MTADDTATQKLLDSVQINNSALDASMNTAIFIAAALAIVGLAAFFALRKVK